jgi:hypothetical protein
MDAYEPWQRVVVETNGWIHTVVQDRWEAELRSEAYVAALYELLATT